MIDVDVLAPAVARLLARPLAPPPPVEDVHRRARSIRTRRAVRRTGAVAIVALALAGAPALWRDSPSVEVRTVPPATSPAEEGSSRPAEVEVTERPGEGSVQRSSTPSVAPVPASGAGVATSAEPPPQPTYEGCRVYSRPRSGTWPVATSGDAVRECTYRATRPGGYEGGGTWTLTIERGGARLTLDSVRSPRCADVGLIRAGDVVHARLGLDGDGPLDASAGEGEWHLWVGSTVGCG